MIFSSYKFIFLFFPAVWLGFLALRRWLGSTAVKVWLVAASLLFYALGQPDYALMFAATVAVNYLLMLGMDRAKKSPWRHVLFAAALVWDLGLLVYFKYLDFFKETVNLVFGTELSLLRPALPIGISFFTFQILAYTAALWRGGAKLPGALDYAVFITFFPQLIVGPLMRNEELVPQIQGDGLLEKGRIDLRRGLMLFSFGCAKKVLLATPLIDMAQEFYSGTVAFASVPAAWLGVFAYVFAYYFDFSGYIDMARGLGYFFGVELPVNFDSPYKARDFADFWRRWNMTVSRFWSDTVFNNLFGFGDGIGRLIFATVATFTVSGLWHGAGWHFVVWGVVNGLLVSLANVRRVRRRKPLPAWLGVTVTFIVGGLVRVLFDANGLTQALEVYKRLFAFGEMIHVRTMWNELLYFVTTHPEGTAALVLGAAVCFLLPNTNSISKKTDFRWYDAAVCGALLGLSLFFMTGVSKFLYFNF